MGLLAQNPGKPGPSIFLSIGEVWASPFHPTPRPGENVPKASQLEGAIRAAGVSSGLGSSLSGYWFQLVAK